MPGLVRCEVLPLPDDRFSFRIDGREITAWHHGPDLKRPFLFPVIGPKSGESLTRLGHPGAPNHDHHDSVWFAHHKVLGIDFWANTSAASIRQLQWLALEDSDTAARLAVRLGWFDGHDPQPLLQQDLVMEVRPLADREFTIELTSSFTPTAESLELQQTNFGIIAIRVARSLSAVFGGGRLTSSTGAIGEQALFDQVATWMDYSGPMPERTADGRRREIEEGLTLFDHPSNPGIPPAGTSVMMAGWAPRSAMPAPVVLQKSSPLGLRYLIHAHAGPLNAETAAGIFSRWSQSPRITVAKSTRPHRQFEFVESGKAGDS